MNEIAWSVIKYVNKLEEIGFNKAYNLKYLHNVPPLNGGVAANVINSHNSSENISI